MDYDQIRTFFSRRQILNGAAAGLAGLAAIKPVEAFPTAAGTGHKGRLNFEDPIDNFTAMMKAWITTRPNEEAMVYFFGVESGFTDGGKTITPLYGRAGTDLYRVIPQADGSYQCMLNELVFYTDLKTGQVLEEVVNPYTGKKNQVFHLRQGPINFTLSPKRFQEAVQLGERERLWTVVEDTAYLQHHSTSKRKNPLDPREWPLESTGEYTNRHEFMLTIAKTSDLEDPDQSNVMAKGLWGSLKDWLPWQEMGMMPGGTFTRMASTKIANFDPIPRHILSYAEKHYPAMLSAPRVWTNEYKALHDNFKAERKPKPASR